MFRKIFKLAVFASLLSAGICYSGPKSVAVKAKPGAFEGKIVRRSSSPKRRQLKKDEIAKILCSRSIIIPHNGDMQATDDLKTIAVGTRVLDISSGRPVSMPLNTASDWLQEMLGDLELGAWGAAALLGDMNENPNIEMHNVHLGRRGDFVASVATLESTDEDGEPFQITSIFELLREGACGFNQSCFINQMSDRDILPEDTLISANCRDDRNIVVNNPSQKPVIKSPHWSSEDTEVEGAKKVIGCGNRLFWSIKEIEGSEHLTLDCILSCEKSDDEFKSVYSEPLDGILVSSSTNVDCTKLAALIEDAAGNRILRVLAKSDTNGVKVVKELKQEDIFGPQSRLSKIKLSANGKVLAACVEGLNNGVVRLDLASGQIAIFPESHLVKDVFPNNDGSKALVYLPGESLVKEIVLAR